ncbi:hypothetical protein DXA36_21580 [Eisenbergiella sp. OF01-20]|nr:hypothetical protein DXA36_21580 [Eisenbergiella sp. OF01-20]
MFYGLDICPGKLVLRAFFIPAALSSRAWSKSGCTGLSASAENHISGTHGTPGVPLMKRQKNFPSSYQFPNREKEKESIYE